MAIFFYCGRLSSAQLVPLQAPKHRPIISPHPVEQTEFRRGIKDNGLYIRLYKFVPGTSTEQVVDKGIRQKSTKEWTHSLTAVLLSGGTEACSLGFRETPACIHVIQRLSQPRVACWHGFRQNSQKTECVFTRCPTGRCKKIACLNGLRSEGVKKLVLRMADIRVPMLHQGYFLNINLLILLMGQYRHESRGHWIGVLVSD